MSVRVVGHVDGVGRQRRRRLARLAPEPRAVACLLPDHAGGPPDNEVPRVNPAQRVASCVVMPLERFAEIVTGAGGRVLHAHVIVGGHLVCCQYRTGRTRAVMVYDPGCLS